MTPILQQASQALSRNRADTLERLCAEAEQTVWSPTPANLAEYAALLTVLRRQVLAARSNLILRQRLLAQRTEVPWAP